MKKDLVIDFETYDPNLKKYGVGWVFKYHYHDDYEFQVLGASVSFVDHNAVEYIDLTVEENKQKLFDILNDSESLIMHNGLYDLGCLKVLYRDDFNVNNFDIWDTLILTRVVNQHLALKGGYSLDAVTKYFKLVNKQSELLHDYVWGKGIYQEQYFANCGRQCHTRPSKNLLEQFCKKDMRIFPVKLVGEYANFDVKATKQLYLLMKEKLSYFEHWQDLSNIVKVVLDMKLHGVRIDLKACEQATKTLQDKAHTEKVSILKYFNDDFNINSVAQLAERLIAKGFKLPTTDKGNPSITSTWLESRKEDIFKSILKYRKVIKVNRDTIQKLIDYQEAIPKPYRESTGRYGMLYPSIHIYGAVATGRDSSGGGPGSKEISIHQVPRRDPELGPICRAIFVPFNNEKFVVADFSSQESRLQVHYAVLTNCDGTGKVVADWHKNPEMKYHSIVADTTQLEYEKAKTINLGLSYGMGEYNLSIALDKPIHITKVILKQYHSMLPFMSQLQDITAASLKRNKYIKTIGGRRLNIDPPFYNYGKESTQEHKALSKLIQGSAADQCKQSMIKAYKAGLRLCLVVHDELVISTTHPETDKDKLKYYMETAYKLKVPVVAEVGIGNNWNEGKV